MSIDAIIGRSVNIEGYKNPVAYDESLTISYGYWICKACKSKFYGGGEALHNSGCSLKDRVQGIYTYSHPEIIYVLGPKESGSFSPFGKEKIEQIKELAKAQSLVKKDEGKSKE